MILFTLKNQKLLKFQVLIRIICRINARQLPDVQVIDTEIKYFLIKNFDKIAYIMAI